MTTSQAPVAIPEGTEYVWTPAYYTPYVSWFRRRAFYKKENGVFYSFAMNGEWQVSNNDVEWFGNEVEAGYFVTIDDFKSKDFVPVEEKL